MNICNGGIVLITYKNKKCNVFFESPCNIEIKLPNKWNHFNRLNEHKINLEKLSNIL